MMINDLVTRWMDVAVFAPNENNFGEEGNPDEMAHHFQSFECESIISHSLIADDHCDHVVSLYSAVRK